MRARRLLPCPRSRFDFTFGSVVLAIATMAFGCAPPSERLSRIGAAEAPVLGEPEEEGPPQWVLHEGDLVRVVRTVRPRFAWKGLLEGGGKVIARDSELIEVRRADGEGTGFGFREDFAGEVEAPTAAWLCRRMQAGPECAGRLRRIAVDPGGQGRAVLAYEGCYVGPCKVALARGRKVSVLTVDALAEMRVATVQGQRVALATARWVRAPNWTGGSLVVLHVDEELRRGLEIVTDEVDARHAVSFQRHGKLSIDGDAIRFHGERQSFLGPVLSSTIQQDEIYKLAPPPAKK